jgi:hypothetical protein
MRGLDRVGLLATLSDGPCGRDWRSRKYARLLINCLIETSSYCLAHLREGNGVQVDTQGDAGIGFIEDMQALWNCGHRSLFVS